MDKDNTDESLSKEVKNKKKKNRKRMPGWLAWGLSVLAISFALTVVFSFLTEVSIKGSPVYICVIVLVVLLVLNIGCDLLANAIITCNPEAFHAMASNKTRRCILPQCHKVGKHFCRYNRRYLRNSQRCGGNGACRIYRGFRRKNYRINSFNRRKRGNRRPYGRGKSNIQALCH